MVLPVQVRRDFPCRSSEIWRAGQFRARSDFWRALEDIGYDCHPVINGNRMSVVCMVIRQLNQIFVFSENDPSSVGDALPPRFCPTSHPFSSHLSAGHPRVDILWWQRAIHSFTHFCNVSSALRILLARLVVTEGRN